jgi:ATP-dependent RNA helicase RhlE
MFRKTFEKRHSSELRQLSGRNYVGRRNQSGVRAGSNRKKTSSIDPELFVRKAIVTTQAEAFDPKHRFADFRIDPKLKANIERRGYVNPTPIQDGAIPVVLENRDVIGMASTGTGKTAAFLIPLLHKVLHKRSTKALIIVPTRELANQIDVEFRDFSRGLGVQSAVCIGGSHIYPQIKRLQQNPNFVIGTPGRLKDLVERKNLDLAPFNVVVLDEVDRMLDMGFIHDMKYLLALLEEPRQTLFFSATLPREIADLAKKFLKDPITIRIESRATSENVEQDIIVVKNRDQKVETLHELFLKEGFEKILVFCRTKHGADRLSKTLRERGFKADALHGDKSQSQRERALRQFEKDELKVLVATDVAARGLDINNITHVINYDVPETYEDYIHRIGRTGRAGKTGNALTFIEGF